MSKNSRKYATPSKSSRTKLGTKPNQSKVPTRKFHGKPSVYYNPRNKQWNQLGKGAVKCTNCSAYLMHQSEVHHVNNNEENPRCN